MLGGPGRGHCSAALALLLPGQVSVPGLGLNIARYNVGGCSNVLCSAKPGSHWGISSQLLIKRGLKAGHWIHDRGRCFLCFQGFSRCDSSSNPACET